MWSKTICSTGRRRSRKTGDVSRRDGSTAFSSPPPSSYHRGRARAKEGISSINKRVSGDGGREKGKQDRKEKIDLKEKKDSELLTLSWEQMPQRESKARDQKVYRLSTGPLGVKSESLFLESIGPITRKSRHLSPLLPCTVDMEV